MNEDNPARTAGECRTPFLGTVIIGFPMIGLLSVAYIAFNDEILSRYVIAVLVLSFWFLVTCCLLVLSRICRLRRKSFAKKITDEQLWDHDLEFENETEAVPHLELALNWMSIKNFLLDNPYEFCIFRPAYGMSLATGFAFLFTCLVFLVKAEDLSTQDDFYCVAAELVFPTLFPIAVVYSLANTGFYVANKELDFYNPFQEFVQVPMKVVVAKSVAAFITSGETHATLVLLIISTVGFCTVYSTYICHTAEHMFLIMLPRAIPYSRGFVVAVLVMSALLCLAALGEIVLSSFIQAKGSILGIIEKNWERNFVAIQFLLPDTRVETLQELKNALDNKRNQPLTKEEKRAFEYISRPLWRTKQPFLGRWSMPAGIEVILGDAPEEGPEHDHLQQPVIALADAEREQIPAQAEVHPEHAEQHQAGVHEDRPEQGHILRGAIELAGAMPRQIAAHAEMRPEHVEQDQAGVHEDRPEEGHLQQQAIADAEQQQIVAQAEFKAPEPPTRSPTAPRQRRERQGVDTDDTIAQAVKQRALEKKAAEEAAKAAEEATKEIKDKLRKRK